MSSLSAYARLIESVRRTRKTLYLVAGLYVGVGFVVAAVTAVNGNLLGTFLGFLIISGALSMAIVARTALHVLVRVAHIEESLGDLFGRVDRIIPILENEGDERVVTASQESPAVLDLAAIGTGQPENLAAATLDRDVYPRLAAAINEEPPEKAVHPAGAPIHGNHGALSTKNLLQSWKTALAGDDLLECRRILGTMVDLADTEEVRPLRLQIEAMEDRLERTLRTEFSRQIRERDYLGSLETGEKFRTLLGERPVAAQFERLRPLLLRKAKNMRTHACVTS